MTSSLPFRDAAFPLARSGRRRPVLDILTDFDAGLGRLAQANPEKAEELRQRQRDAASKVHRSSPPSLDGMRF